MNYAANRAYITLRCELSATLGRLGGVLHELEDSRRIRTDTDKYVINVLEDCSRSIEKAFARANRELDEARSQEARIAA